MLLFILYIHFISFAIHKVPLHGIGTSQRFSLWCLCDITTGSLDSFAGFGLDPSALSILAEGLIGGQFWYALWIALWIAVLDVRLDLSREKEMVWSVVALLCNVCNEKGIKGYTFFVSQVLTWALAKASMSSAFAATTGVKATIAAKAPAFWKIPLRE